MAHVSVKSHANGAKNPKAHLRKPIDEEAVLNAPIIAEPLGVFDCCGVSDGSACAIVTTPEIARRLGKTDLVAVKAMSLSVSKGWELQGSGWDGSYFHTTRIAASRAYKEAGITNPRKQISLLEVHDCFSITELVTMEDLGVSEAGRASCDILDGMFDADGKIPCQIDGGLKCFGHPIGASGLRMIYENYLQLLGRAGPRQVSDQPTLALSHNLGGMPNQNVSPSPSWECSEPRIVDRDVFESLKKELRRYVRERLVPLENQITEDDRIPDEVIGGDAGDGPVRSVYPGASTVASV